ncbi:DUF3224 domain-containing protein [Thermobifida cellulosilytica]|uniref:DUF3224 domain-containing protein n=1 Tax=Thermobifida cellulosilytica TaxID=144786 RepID=UPI000838FFF6|nr:DUF3224 domain-containing protein [Thermobifida cellulosilytica]
MEKPRRRRTVVLVAVAGAVLVGVASASTALAWSQSDHFSRSGPPWQRECPRTGETLTATVDLLDQTVTEIGPPDDPSGTQIVDTQFQTEFSGGLKGNGYHVYIEVVQPDGSSKSSGLGRFVGELDGRSGTFGMEAAGTMDSNGAISSYWRIVEGSATGELTGLRGCGTINTTGTPQAHITLKYQLP